MAGEGEVTADSADLFRYRTDVNTAMNHFNDTGTTALMTMSVLGTGVFSGIGTVQAVLAAQGTTAQTAQTVLRDGVSGLSYLGLGAGLLGMNYDATDGNATSRINQTMVDGMLAPPPPGQAGGSGMQTVPLTPEQEAEALAIRQALAGQRGGSASATRRFNGSTGAVTVTVPDVPAIAAPALPGEDAPAIAAPALPGAPSSYTTLPEGELNSDGLCFTTPGGTCYDETGRRIPPALPTP